MAFRNWPVGDDKLPTMIFPMFLSWCLAVPGVSPPVEPEGSMTLISLADSLQPLRERFNSEKDKHRFIAILSPT